MSSPTFDTLLEQLIARRDAAVWIRRSGRWQASAEAYGRAVLELAAGLTGFGTLARGPAVILGRSDGATVGAALAVLAAGAQARLLDAAVSDRALGDALSTSRASLAIVADDTQLRRVLRLRPDLPQLEMVLLVEVPVSERKPAALPVRAAAEAGAAHLAEDPECVARARAENAHGGASVVFPDRPGSPALDPAALASRAFALRKVLDLEGPRSLMVALPLDDPANLPAYLAAIAAGGSVLVPSPDERLDAGLSERKPDRALVSLATIRRLQSSILEDLEGSTWPRRTGTRWALRGGSDAARSSWKHRIADRLFLRPIRERFGGRLARWDVIGGDLPKDVSDLFAGIGTPTYVVTGAERAGVAR